MDGIADTKATIREVKQLYGNPSLRDFGLMPNKVEKRSKLHALNMAQLQNAGIKIFDVTIYRRSDVENKLYEGKRSPVLRPAVDAILKGMGLV
jgi:cellulose biosynthesis protein BcsQ